jgi:hypothetical protein
MPIDSKHIDYEANEYVWWYCNTFYKGSRAVREADDKLLPRLSGQDVRKYRAYRDRAVVPGYVPRTVAALVGAIFRRNPHFAIDERLSYLLTNADGRGSTLMQFAVRLVTEIMITGRSSIVVDRPIEGGLPYLCLYDADDLINWDEEEDFFVYKHKVLEGTEEDRYKKKEKTKYRELSLVNGLFTVTEYEQEGGPRSDYKPSSVGTPLLKNGKPIDYVPMVCVTPTGLGFEVSNSPILELCEVTHSAYQVSADWMNALHVMGSPTPVISSDAILQQAMDGKFTFNMGVDTALVVDSQGKASFLESARDLGALEKAMTRLQELAAVLGARLLDTGSNSVMDTATSAMIKEGASTAILSSVISSAEQALATVLAMVADMENVDGDIEVSINKELIQSRVDANMLSAMFNAVLGNRMSFETFYHNLEEGGLTKPGTTAKDEMRKIIEDYAVLKQLAVDANPMTGVDNVQDM